jgi:hypothetical protein
MSCVSLTHPPILEILPDMVCDSWVNQATANTSRLTYVDPVTNHAFLRVDNSSRLAAPARRNAVRINTNELYGVGTVWVGDFVHVPFGVRFFFCTGFVLRVSNRSQCSVWGAFWSTATEAEIAPAVWPTGGEIDLFEAYNLFVDLTPEFFPRVYLYSPLRQSSSMFTLHTNPVCRTRTLRPSCHADAMVIAGLHYTQQLLAD